MDWGMGRSAVTVRSFFGAAVWLLLKVLTNWAFCVLCVLHFLLMQLGAELWTASYVRQWVCRCSTWTLAC